ncbi:hypothetical protein I3843_06G067100 [Carya illinoinensis]|nr:hypothetical protein I3843_06G067100 [Carya illinoinensis]
MYCDEIEFTDNGWSNFFHPSVYIFLVIATNEQELSPPQVEVIEIEPSGRKTQRDNNFSNEEDLLLVEGWLETSLDVVQGKDQKHTMLWKRIHKYFEENKKFEFLRNYTFLMNQWSTIQQVTNKFCGYLAQVEGMHPSGFNKQDKVLRFHPKWVEHMDTVKPKKKPSSHDLTPNSINLGENEDFHVASSNLERPIGLKARLEEKKENERIMTLNTSAMPPMLQQYYLQQQMKILASRVGKN